MMKHSWAMSLGTGVLLAFAGSVSGKAASFRTLLLTGMDAPGIPGVAIAPPLLGPFVLGSGGHAVVAGVFFDGAGINGLNDRGMYMSDGVGSSLDLVMRRGEQLPMQPAGVLHSGNIASPDFNFSGESTFVTQVIGAGTDRTNDRVVMRSVSGTGFEAIARTGAQAPGLTAGIEYDSFFLGSNVSFISNAGDTLFEASLRGSGVDITNRSSIFIHRPNSGTTMIARGGDQVPGLAEGVVWRGLSGALTDSGAMLVTGSLAGAGIEDVVSFAIHSSVNGSELVPRAWTGLQAPGLPAGVTYRQVYGQTKVNDAGEVAFIASLTGVLDRGIFSDGGASAVSLVARVGDHAPGLPASVQFAGFDAPAFNNRGDLAFRGRLSSDRYAIFAEVDGIGLTAIAIEGSQAPGTKPGVPYSGIDADVLLNDSGDILFTAQVADFHSALFAANSAGGVELLVAEGQMFNVSNDPANPDLRLITIVGLPTGLNDAGEFIHRLGFADGSSGVFVGTVPSPGVLTPAGLFALVGLRRRRGCSRRRSY